MADATQNRVEFAQAVLLEGELGRRLVHASGSGLPALYLFGWGTWAEVRLLFLLCALGTIGLEIMRLSVGIDWVVFEHLTREYEEDGVAGYMLYMVSTAIVAVVFQPQVAIPALLMLMIGDPLSGSFSDDTLRTVKRPRELGAMFVICALIALPFLLQQPLALLFGGLAGMAADGVKPKVGEFIVDDNLTIAPAAALAIWVGIQLSSGGLVAALPL